MRSSVSMSYRQRGRAAGRPLDLAYIVREMLHGVTHFNDLERCLPGISRSVLAQRMRQMERTGPVESRRADSGRTIDYHLAPAGRELEPVVHPDPSELDADLLMRWISRHINSEHLPAQRVVIRFDFARARRRRFWMVLESGDASLCLEDSGFDTDVIVASDPESLYGVYLGRISLTAALRTEVVTLTGPTKLTRAPRWFAWSSFAPAVRDAECPADRLAALPRGGRRRLRALCSGSCGRGCPDRTCA